MTRIPHCCPLTGAPLQPEPEGLRRGDGALFRHLPDLPWPAPNFLDLAMAGDSQRASLAMYDSEAAVAFYRNFLDWLFATFGESEAAWRSAMVARLRLNPGDAVLVTGCGLGDDIVPIIEAVGPGGEVHAQDLSPAMIGAAVARFHRDFPGLAGRVNFSVGDAQRLPFPAQAFDAAFHFGGINLFDDIGAGIAEMARVVRRDGRVVFGDEGVAPWLRETEYGRMVIANNPLWGLSAPIGLLPGNAADVTLDWVLGQCFWVIGFSPAEGPPAIDPHVPHKGRRGGSMWTRRHGVLEGVTPALKTQAEQAAAAAGLSVHQWLEDALRARLDQSESSTATPKPPRP